MKRIAALRRSALVLHVQVSAQDVHHPRGHENGQRLAANADNPVRVMAVRLDEITGLPVVELDKFFWQPGLAATSHDHWIAIQERLIAEEGWIMDGDLARFSAALGEQLGGRANAPASDVGCCRITGKPVRFSGRQSPTTQSMRTSMYFGTRRRSGGSSRR